MGRKVLPAHLTEAVAAQSLGRWQMLPVQLGGPGCRLPSRVCGAHTLLGEQICVPHTWQQCSFFGCSCKRQSPTPRPLDLGHLPFNPLIKGTPYIPTVLGPSLGTYGSGTATSPVLKTLRPGTSLLKEMPLKDGYLAPMCIVGLLTCHSHLRVCWHHLKRVGPP